MLIECDYMTSELTKCVYEFQRDIIRTTTNKVNSTFTLL